MAIFVDTCFLVPALNRQSQAHVLGRRVLKTLVEKGESFVVSPQILAEFWNVSTRPVEHNGLGLPVNRVRKSINVIVRLCTIEYETPSVLARWRSLVFKHNVRGASVHDARLVAIMIDHGHSQILTFNAADFRRYGNEGIDVILPESAVEP